MNKMQLAVVRFFSYTSYKKKEYWVDYVQFIIFMLSSVIMYIIVMANLSKLKLTIWDYFFEVAIIMAIGYIIISVEISEIFANISIVIIMALFAYKKSKSLPLSIFFSLMATIIVLVADSFSVFVLAVFFSADVHVVRVSWLLYSVNIVATVIPAYIISKHLGSYIDDKLRIFTQILKNKFATNIIYAALITLAISYGNAFVFDGELDYQIKSIFNAVLAALYFIFLTSMMYTSIAGKKKDEEIAHKQELLDNLQTYTSNIENLYNGMMKYRHDNTNILTSFYGYIEADDMAGMREYFISKISPINKETLASNETMGRLAAIHIPELKGLLAIKLLYAQECKIKVDIEAQETIESIDFEAVDLCRVVGILVDNATEECQSMEKSALKVAFIRGDAEVEIVFSNTFASPPPLSKIFDEGFSTKPGSRGRGLSIAKTVIEKYRNVFLDTEITENRFIQRLVVCRLNRQ